MLKGKGTWITTEDRVKLDARLVIASRDAPVVILAHGITVDMEEEGAFANLARALAEAGLSSLRFSFRGHGRSSLPSTAMTVAGEMMDLKAVVDHVTSRHKRLLAVVAASFGATPTSLLSPYLSLRTSCLAFWNPVLDLHKTFVRPTTPWGRKNFRGANVAKACEGTGGFRIDRTFRVGVVFWQELHNLRPHAVLATTRTPALILHGDKDGYVPIATSRDMARARPRTRLVVIRGADHGFPKVSHERRAIEETVRFVHSYA